MAGGGLAARPLEVARAIRECVLPCGIEPVNRFERVLEAKFADTRALEHVAPESFDAGWGATLDGVVSARPHRASLLRENSAETLRSLLREVRTGRHGAGELATLAERLRGGPMGVRIDLAAELMHAAAPDRVALLSRWVWNPARHTGILGGFGGPPPETYAGMQARLAEIRLELDALGFRSASFAAVDVLLALTYASRLGEAVDRSLKGGGLERLLPGAFPLATIVLGVRRRYLDADR